MYASLTSIRVSCCSHCQGAYRSSHIPAAHPKYCQSSHERCSRTTEKHLKSPGLGDLHHNIYSSQDHASKQNKTTKNHYCITAFYIHSKLENRIERQETLKGLWKGTKLLISESDWSLPEAESQEFQLDLCVTSSLA